MNFLETFVKWVIGNILFNASSYLLVNGEIFSKINMFNSLKKGCPLSPFLYDILIEVLMEIVEGLYVRKHIQGIDVHKLRNQIFQDLFVDEYVFIIIAKKEDLDNLMGGIQLSI